MTGSIRFPVEWRLRLAVFPPELGVTLGEMMARLAPALHGGDRGESEGSFAMDGFDGLTRRGLYERLLSTEWALARAAPLEFLRRAADAEHSFLKPNFTENAARRGTVALFEAGPHQIGSCRVVALALLFLLNERALARGGVLGWHLLHQLGETPLTTLDEQSVRTFIGGRTGLVSSPRQVAHWRRRFPQQELWVIGRPALLESIPKGVNAIALAERVCLGPGAVDVQVVRAGQSGRSVALAEPAPEVATRLLRNPFPHPPSGHTARTPAPRSNILLAPAGNRLFFEGGDGQLIALPVPTSPAHSPGKPSCYQVDPHLRVIGVGRAGGVLHWLSASPERLVLASTKSAPQRRSWAGVPAHQWVSTNTLWPLVVFEDPLRVLFVAPDRSLHRVTFPDGQDEMLGTGVLAFVLRGAKDPARRGGALAVLNEYAGNGGNPALLAIDPGGLRQTLSPMIVGKTAHVRATCERLLESLTCAVELEAGKFDVLVSEELPGQESPIVRSTRLASLPGTHVVGVDSTGTRPSEVGLYVLADEGTALSAVTRGTSRELVRTHSPIEHLAFASASGRIAYMTRDGELTFRERLGRKLWSGRISAR